MSENTIEPTVKKQDEAETLYEKYLDDIAENPQAIALLTATAPAVEGRAYVEKLTPIEKDEADEMAREWIAKNGAVVSQEILRVIRVLQDPETDMPRAGRRVLRAYLDSLVDENRANQGRK